MLGPPKPRRLDEPIAVSLEDPAEATVTVAEIFPEIAVSGDDNCDGQLTLTASAPGFTGCSFTWTIDGVAAAPDADPANGSVLSYRILDDSTTPVCHFVEVTATCGGCTGTADVTISQCVSTVVGCDAGFSAAARTAQARSKKQSSGKKGKQGGKKGKPGGKKGKQRKK
jgi:hypothetical protein